jgi:succinyl-CoA synthetase alpha subunit
MVGGHARKRAASEIDGFPVFNTVRRPVTQTGANASVIYVPPHWRGLPFWRRLMPASSW